MRRTSDQDSAALLAAFATELSFAAIPEPAVAIARACLADAVACCIFGSRFRWSMAVREASVLPPGKSSVPGTDIRTSADKAALIAGVFAHAFELDSLRKPGAGVHPGATVALPALAVAQEVGAGGGDLLAAIVAGCEVMFRLGAATLHTAERRGFHAPGITGVFGSAAAAGRLLGLDSRQIGHALGIAGSMSGGILAFAGAGSGGMVKRLHLGRAAESGVLAAKLAAAGFEAPHDIFETHFGVLEVFCLDNDPALLTAGLGREFDIEKTCIKRFPCHVTAQAPIELMRRWIADERLNARDIHGIEMDVPPKIGSHHAARKPLDMALAQYSVPFMLAVSAFYDLDDPFSLTDAAIADPRVRDLAGRIDVNVDERLKGWGVRLRVKLGDGRCVEGEASSFAGAPDRRLSREQLRTRFMNLTADRPSEAMASLFEEVMTLGDEDAALPVGPDTFRSAATPADRPRLGAFRRLI